MESKRHSPLLIKYLNIYEQNPKSRVFAPLAETYRKVGLIEKALPILKKGIQLHPDYVLGHLTLAHCYYDREQFELAYRTLRPFVNSNKENINLQRIFANSAKHTRRTEEALEAFKMILFISPSDREAMAGVKELENQYQALLPVHQIEEKIPGSDLGFEDFDQWSQQAHYDQREAEVELTLLKNSEERSDEESEIEDWSMPEQFSEKRDDWNDVNLDLADIYCRNGHYERALEILKKFDEAFPNNNKIIQKRTDVEKMFSQHKKNSIVLLEEDEVGREETKSELIALFNTFPSEERKPKRNLHNDRLIARLDLFLKHIKHKSEQRRGHLAQ